MATTYGAVTNPISINDDVESSFEDNCEKELEQEPKSIISFAAKSTGAILFLGTISLMAVSASRSMQSTSVTKAAFTVEPDEYGRVSYGLLTDEQKLSLFTDFMTTYSRDYLTDSSEYDKRFNIFKANLDIADERNIREAAVGGVAIHSVTKFSDLTSNEFLTTYLMQDDESRRLAASAKKVTFKQSSKKASAYAAKSTSARSITDPTLMYVDWSSTIATGVKNTGACAGTWAIAAAEQIESDGINAGLLDADTSLSSQQILSCTDYDQHGCTTGAIELAYDYVTKPGGIYLAADYPYTADEGSVSECETVVKPYALTIGGYFSLNNGVSGSTDTERMMVTHLTDQGTLSVCLDATIWSTYSSGTMSNCDGNDINHCVQVVGMYYSSATDAGYYKVRNSWGTDWGINGYISLTYGTDTCGVSANPMYTDPVKDETR